MAVIGGLFCYNIGDTNYGGACMGKKRTLIVVILIAIAFSIGYFFTRYYMSKNESEKNNMEGNKTPDIREPIDKEKDEIKALLSQMTIEEKVGQMFIVGVEGSTLNDSIKEMARDYHVGGFIFMGKSVKSTSQLLKLLNAVKIANSNNKIPLFLSIDQEGGRVDRLPVEFNRFPTNREIGRINSEELSYNIGSTLAYEIGSFGFNMDFAPVLDVDTNPKNTVIGDRAFSTSPKVVSSLGVETMKGLQDGNVISVGKHFPGHGDTTVDSHVGLPKVNKDLKQLASSELIPFKKAIENNVDGIMIAHILLPKIDSKYPATLSKTVISDILRGQLGFKGIVITDDMTMGAIAKNYKIGAAAVSSIEAGSDIILIAHDYNKGRDAITSIIKEVNNGNISMDRIDESLYRILKLKKKYNLQDNTIDSVDVKEINGRIDNTLGEYFK